MSLRKPTDNELKYMRKIAGNCSSSLKVESISGKYSCQRLPQSLDGKPVPYSHFIGSRKMVLPEHWDTGSFQNGYLIETEACECNGRLVVLGFDGRYFIDADVTNGLLKLKSPAVYIAALTAVSVFIICSLYFMFNFSLFPDKPEITVSEIETLESADCKDVRVNEIPDQKSGFIKLSVKDSFYFQNRLYDRERCRNFYEKFRAESDHRIMEAFEIYRIKFRQLRDEKYWKEKEKIFGPERIAALRDKLSIFNEILNELEETERKPDSYEKRFDLIMGLVAGLELNRNDLFSEFLKEEGEHLSNYYWDAMEPSMNSSPSFQVFFENDYIEDDIRFAFDFMNISTENPGYDWSRLDKIFLEERLFKGIIHYSPRGNYIYTPESFREIYGKEIAGYDRNIRARRIFLAAFVLVFLVCSYAVYVWIHNYRLSRKLFNYSSLNLVLKDAAGQFGLDFTGGSIMRLPGVSGSVGGISIRTAGVRRANTPFIRFMFSSGRSEIDTFAIAKENAVSMLGKFVGIQDYITGDAEFDAVMKIKSSDIPRLSALMGKETRKKILRMAGISADVKITDSSALFEVKASSGLQTGDIMSLITAATGMLQTFSENNNYRKLILENITEDEDGVKISNISVIKEHFGNEDFHMLVDKLLSSAYSEQVQISALELIKTSDTESMVGFLIMKSIHEQTFLQIINRLIKAEHRISPVNLKSLFVKTSDTVRTRLLDLVSLNLSGEHEKFLLSVLEKSEDDIRIKIIETLSASLNEDVYSMLAGLQEGARSKAEKQALHKSLSIIRARLKKGSEGQLSINETDGFDGALSVDDRPAGGSLGYADSGKKS